MSIVNDCMIVNLQIGMWVGQRLDMAASAKVTHDANASEDAARVNKHIIPKESLQPIRTAASALRNHFYNNTLPWKDNGDRLLIRKQYTKFMDEHMKLVNEFDVVKAMFLDTSYPRVRDQAEFRMGELFNARDYPSSSELKHRFYVNLDIDAVTMANDFRVTLDAKEQERVKDSMEQALRKRLGTAMEEVWTRLAKTLKQFAEQVGSDVKFRDSTVENLEEIVDLLPDLNILQDARLEQLRQEIKDNLTGYDPKLLRKDDAARKVVAGEAKRIIDTMSGFMNAFGGAK